MTNTGNTNRRTLLSDALFALEEMQAKLDEAQSFQREPIAVIGMGCRWPGGVTDAEGFWSLLQDGRGGIRDVPEDRWDSERYYDPDPSKPGRPFKASYQAGRPASISMPIPQGSRTLNLSKARAHNFSKTVAV